MGKIYINGDIKCAPDDLALMLGAVPEHVALTRAEPGCIDFDIAQSDDDPCCFVVSEVFQDQSAFDAHTQRTRASDWWEKTKHIPRNLTVSEAK